jgi:hypothetical protein
MWTNLKRESKRFLVEPIYIIISRVDILSFIDDTSAQYGDFDVSSLIKIQVEFF